MNTDSSNLEFGPVLIVAGRHKGRVGYYDNDGENKTAVVYFGSPFLCRAYEIIPYRFLRFATTRDLFERREEIFRLIGIGRKDELPLETQYELLKEQGYISDQLFANYLDVRYGNSSKLAGKKVFISHSSKDKPFVNTLAADLARYNIEPWVDEWKIRVGQSIPARIGEGIKEADFVILILSKNSTKSKWVEIEWQAKYWSEIQSGKVALLPILLEKCEIPELLKAKKFANFTNSYHEGLTEVFDAIAAN